jgi:hypothetical protein
MDPGPEGLEPWSKDVRDDGGLRRWDNEGLGEADGTVAMMGGWRVVVKGIKRNRRGEWTFLGDKLF